MEQDLGKSWEGVLKEEVTKPYFAQLTAFVENERLLFSDSIYPPKELVFNSLQKTPFDQVRVVIIGQDPYHRPGQAHGLAFSVPKGIAFPPSLKNIFKELHEDLGYPIPSSGSLSSWAEQGVLLLNATLTVRQGEPMSHHGRGWEQFTDAIVEKLCMKEDPVIFVLWGKSAQNKCQLILNDKKHVCLVAPHPSPFSAHQGFFGCCHFSKINKFLTAHALNPINWG